MNIYIYIFLSVQVEREHGVLNSIHLSKLNNNGEKGHTRLRFLNDDIQ